MKLPHMIPLSTPMMPIFGYLLLLACWLSFQHCISHKEPGHSCPDSLTRDTIFLKVSFLSSRTTYCNMYILLNLDIFLSTAMIPRRRAIRWINRQGFATRKGVILQWFLLGHVLILGYKSTLLSTLIPIRYENTIDSLTDMANSGLALTVPRATTLHKLISTDPRPSMKEIYERRHFVSLPMHSSMLEKLEIM